MFNYIFKRIVSSVITLLLITTITFFLVHQLPGDPFASEKAIPPKIKAKLMEKYDLDKPLPIQYVKYVGNLLKGDFGLSMKVRGRKVSSMIKNHFPYSLDLGIRAAIFAFFVGVFLGIIAGLNRGKKLDSGAMLLAVIGVSVPSFVLAGTLQWIIVAINGKFGISLLPVAGYDTWQHKVLPTIALGLFPVAVIARMMRASMIDVFSQDYIITAKSKGQKPFKIVTRHGIRNAIMPVVVYMGPLLAAITTGSFVIEKIFSIPGLGRYYVESIYNRDYTVVLGITIFYAFLLVVMLLIVDILYVFIDPRVRLSKGKGE
ncbi:oligopeptide transport system permease protein [Hypnocyclicus thermotrophus]|uniref:Oligopeptide transport system permease protein n=1 Tax=Hypnocyclicus thermotrophus TaxID=1627895 RepID=A0AA46DYJ2_9FUSO|nr:ABC transporter permease [Hypnocyclicus thermotrophus]TDT69742.1 oligopeptide transport system permease protein [Hypnocyclicus thermotrophus]